MNTVFWIVSALLAGAAVWRSAQSGGIAAMNPAVDDAEPFTPAGDECRRDGAREHEGTKQFRDFVLRRFGGLNLGILGDAAHQQGCSAHNTGRAWDWGTVKGAYKNNPAADTEGLLKWLSANNWENARRVGIGYFIWNRRIWNAKNKIDGSGDDGWKPYTGSDAHNTHMHFTLTDAGADGKTSAYTKGLLKS